MVQQTIRIGTMVNAADMAGYIRQILPHGFESFSLSWWETIGHTDLRALAGRVKDVLAGSGAVISSLSVFGNTLESNEKAQSARDGWEKLIDAASLFGCDLVTGFAGRIVNRPVPESIGRFAEVFGPLARRAADRGVRLALENCRMGGSWGRGDWNIAFGPRAWEMMFQAVDAPNVCLQWEPAHQLTNLVDPIPQLKKWVKKVFAVHGKDATISWDVIRQHGVFGPERWAQDRTPGFGDTNWTDVISVLREGGFVGSIDIEGWHDPVYRGELEMTGQVHALNHLKRCRGGDVVANPR